MMTLADAIIEQDISLVMQYLHHGVDLNQLDEYGFTPLIEACIVENIEIAELLLKSGANANLQDSTGGTPLSWAAENNHLAMAKLLLQYRANPNSYTFSGQPVLVMPTLRRQSAMRRLLVHAGADQTFSSDFINVKCLGHFYELVGSASIIAPNHHYVEVDFEGFYLEVTLSLMVDALMQFQNHFASRQLRHFSSISQFIVNIFQRTIVLMDYQKHFATIEKFQKEIEPLLNERPLLIPVGYEGHAITFILYNDIWIKCDRREDSRLYDNIMFYRIQNMNAVTREFLMSLFYRQQRSEFINEGLDQLLGLTPMTELKISSQISGNCSWANVEAVIPSLFYLVLQQNNSNHTSENHLKNLAIHYFQRFRDWNKERAIHYCIRSFKESDPIRKASKAEILASILFQRLNRQIKNDHELIEEILALLIGSPYEYILKNYVKVFYFEKYTEAGKQFFDLVRTHGLKI